MDNAPTRPPVLSTPDALLADSRASAVVQPNPITDTQLEDIYEIDRTVSEIRKAAWRRVALQFPDDLLPDAPRIYRRLRDRLKEGSNSLDNHEHATSTSNPVANPEPPETSIATEVVLFILADTSYSACCVDEVAAEHIDAEAVIHYGRACLSPTARLPVIHVFTVQALSYQSVVEAFQRTYNNKDDKVILAADMPYASHLGSLARQLREQGYQNLFTTNICHNPSSPIPNRTIPEEAIENQQALGSWHIFHVSEPPKALLLTLASLVSSIHVYPTETTANHAEALKTSTTLALRRRYALVTRLSRASIIGILVNTLSVHAYQAALEGTQARIKAAGKQAYVFAMGRLNSAKIANFAEVDGWVVLGCWESSLIENSEFDKPVVAPFELELALQRDEDRVWTGEWRGDFNNMATEPLLNERHVAGNGESDHEEPLEFKNEGWQALASDSESEPPEFDLRTGQYIKSSKIMAPSSESSRAKGINRSSASNALAHRAKGDLALIGGEISPGAQFLREKRTWRGLGSDFEIAYEDEEKDTTAIREGRSGIARGYENERSSERPSGDRSNE